MCFLRQEPNLAPEILKSDKIDYQKPRAELSVRELGSPNLDKSSQAKQKPSAGTKDEKGAIPCKRGTFEGTAGRFLEISSTKIVKTLVFRGKEALFEERSFPVSLFHRPEPNK